MTKWRMSWPRHILMEIWFLTGTGIKHGELLFICICKCSNSFALLFRGQCVYSCREKIRYTNVHIGRGKNLCFMCTNTRLNMDGHSSDTGHIGLQATERMANITTYNKHINNINVYFVFKRSILVQSFTNQWLDSIFYMYVFHVKMHFALLTLGYAYVRHIYL